MKGRAGAMDGRVALLFSSVIGHGVGSSLPVVSREVIVPRFGKRFMAAILGFLVVIAPLSLGGQEIAVPSSFQMAEAPVIPIELEPLLPTTTSAVHRGRLGPTADSNESEPSLLRHLMTGAAVGGFLGLVVGWEADSDQLCPADIGTSCNSQSDYYNRILGTAVGAVSGAVVGGITYLIRRP